MFTDTFLGTTETLVTSPVGWLDNLYKKYLWANKINDIELVDFAYYKMSRDMTKPTKDVCAQLNG